MKTITREKLIANYRSFLNNKKQIAYRFETGLFYVYHSLLAECDMMSDMSLKNVASVILSHRNSLYQMVIENRAANNAILRNIIKDCNEVLREPIIMEHKPLMRSFIKSLFNA